MGINRQVELIIVISGMRVSFIVQNHIWLFCQIGINHRHMCCNGKKSRITLALRFLFIFLASFPVILYLLWVASCHLIVWDTSWAKGVKEFMMKLTNKQSIKSCLKATENPTREFKIVGAHMNIFDYSCSIKTPENIVTSRQQWTATIVSAVLENNQRDFQHLLIEGCLKHRDMSRSQSAGPNASQGRDQQLNVETVWNKHW